jgi:23S rRNA (guanosine2251-2'-O)-methyltransferase
MPDPLVYQATTSAAAYAAIDRLPVIVMLDRVRSLYNVGSFFRTAEHAVPSERCGDAVAALGALRTGGYQLAAVETSLHATDLFDWQPQFPVCLVFGHEVDGVAEPVLDCCDVHVRIPTLGLKQSLNVATAGGVVLYELLRKYRALLQRTDTPAVSSPL